MKGHGRVTLQGRPPLREEHRGGQLKMEKRTSHAQMRGEHAQQRDSRDRGTAGRLCDGGQGRQKARVTRDHVEGLKQREGVRLSGFSHNHTDLILFYVPHTTF